VPFVFGVPDIIRPRFKRAVNVAALADASKPMELIPFFRGEQKTKTGRKGAHPEVKPKNRAGKSLVGNGVNP
jgi:hypothetical protein